MRFLRPLSKILILIPIVMLIYDLVKEWFVNARLYVRSLQEWTIWIDPEWLDPLRNAFKAVFSSNAAQAIMDAPAPLVLIVPPIILYLIYRIIFSIRGGHGAGRITFRSHD
jgi:hypothetical protein